MSVENEAYPVYERVCGKWLRVETWYERQPVITLVRPSPQPNPFHARTKDLPPLPPILTEYEFIDGAYWGPLPLARTPPVAGEQRGRE